MQHILKFNLIFKNNFVDKNKNTVPKAIKDICQNLNMRLDNKTILDNTTHGKSTTFLVKMDTEKLIRKLDGTVSWSTDFGFFHIHSLIEMVSYKH